MSYVYHTSTPKAHKSPSSCKQVSLSLSNMVLLTFPWLLKNTQQLNTSIWIVLKDAWTTPVVLEGAWTGSVTLEDAQTGGCLQTPEELEDAGPSICACLLQATHELSNTDRTGVYISPTWKASSSGCNTHESNNPTGVKDFPFRGSEKGISSLMPPLHCSTEPFKTRDEEQ